MNLADMLMPAAMAVVHATTVRPIMQATRDPETCQNRLLADIIRENRKTGFGRAHGFADIRSPEDFRRQVPVQSWEMLAPFITRQIATGEPAATSDPILSLARTSGTTGRAKDIPLTARALRSIKTAQRVTAATLHRHTDFFRGRILAMYSSATEGEQENRIPYGAASGQAYQNTPGLIRSKFAYPPALAEISDYGRKYYLYLLFGLLEDETTGIATANPSSLCRLAELLTEARPALIRDLARGTSPETGPGTLANALKTRWRQKRHRARQVLDWLQSDRDLTLADLWPQLSAVTCWTGGSCGIALNRLRTLLPARTRFVEIGYRASEFTGTVNIDARTNACIPLLTDTVFEFIHQTDREQGRHCVTPWSKLKQGENYYVLVTTRSGLYRYDINDIVRVDGFVNQCPVIRFLQKGKGVTSITGEKLHLHQVMAAVEYTSTDNDLTPGFFLMQADEEQARYRLHLELPARQRANTTLLAQQLDRHLTARNLEYADKRASNRLKEPIVKLLRAGAGEAAKRHAIAAGQRESQYKPDCLTYRRKDDGGFDIDGWLQ